jgi:hypothetical protein
MTDIYNGKITDTELGLFYEGRVWSADIVLAYGDRGYINRFGGWNLVGNDMYKFVSKLLAALRIELWEQLKGTFVRVRVENEKIVAIGHIIEDRWFALEEMRE